LKESATFFSSRKKTKIRKEGKKRNTPQNKIKGKKASGESIQFPSQGCRFSGRGIPVVEKEGRRECGGEEVFSVANRGRRNGTARGKASRFQNAGRANVLKRVEL